MKQPAGWRLPAGRLPLARRRPGAGSGHRPADRPLGVGGADPYADPRATSPGPASPSGEPAVVGDRDPDRGDPRRPASTPPRRCSACPALASGQQPLGPLRPAPSGFAADATLDWVGCGAQTLPATGAFTGRRDLAGCGRLHLPGRHGGGELRPHGCGGRPGRRRAAATPEAIASTGVTAAARSTRGREGGARTRELPAERARPVHLSLAPRRLPRLTGSGRIRPRTPNCISHV